MNKYSHNLLATVHAFVCKYQEDSDLLLTLYDADEMKAITENYVVKWGRQGVARDIDQFDNQRVLFTDLSSQDLNRNKVYLICYAVRIGTGDVKEGESKRHSMLGVGSKKSPHHSISSISSSGSHSTHDCIRRPFGVAAIDLTPIIRKPEDFQNNLDLPFILCEKDNLDSTLRKLIANKDVGKIDSKLAVSVELLHGDIKQVCIDAVISLNGGIPRIVVDLFAIREAIFPHSFYHMRPKCTKSTMQCQFLATALALR